MFNGGQSGVLFGGTATQINAFGQTPSNVTGFFGTNTGVNGTTYSYQPIDSTDTIQKNNSNININTKLHCLTAMPVYEKKSIEELRSEDYQANRLTKTTNTMFAGQNSGMINPQPTMFTSTYQPSQGTLFAGSNQQTNTFGNKSLFSGANTSFGTFNNQSKPNSLFSTNTTSTVNKPLFGNVQPTQSTSIFGSSTGTGTTSIFGANSTQTFFGTQQQTNQPTSLFGSTINTSSFGFQAPTNNSLFGATTKPFGTPSSTTSVFGNATSTGGSIFGQQTVPGVSTTTFGGAAKTPMFSGTFAANNTSTGLFAQPATNSLFGNLAKPAATPGGFGSTSIFSGSTISTKPSLFGTPNTGSGLFGNPGSTSVFGNQSAAPGTLGGIGWSSAAEAQMQQQESQRKILTLCTNRPYGVNPMFMGLNLNPERVATAADPLNNTLLPLAIKKHDTDPSTVSQRRKILSQPTKISSKNLYKVFSGFDNDEDDFLSKSNKTERPFLIKREDWKYLPPNAFDKCHDSINSNVTLNNNATKNSNMIHNSNPPKISNMALNNNVSKNSNAALNNDVSKNSNNARNSKNSFVTPLKNAERKLHSTPILEKSPDDINPSFTYSPIGNETVFNEISRSSSFEKLEEIVESKVESRTANHCGITLTKAGYYTAPTIDVLDKLVTKISSDGYYENDGFECWVENFIIGRQSYGSIRFPGLTNVYGLNLDDLVDIRCKEVSVYPNEDTKPDDGEELNKLAQIFLQQVWPTDKSTNELIVDVERLRSMNFEDKLQRVTQRMGARFISYDGAKGLWIFEVDHFSKYGYMESDDEEEDKPTTVFSKETKEDKKPPVVISAEADSQTSFQDEIKMPPFNGSLHQLFGQTNNLIFQRMKHALYQDNDVEDDSGNSGLFSSVNQSFGVNIRHKEEPQLKPFKRKEMNWSKWNSSVNNSMVDYENQSISGVEIVANDHVNNRPIRALLPEHIASTEPIVNNPSTTALRLPQQFRNIRSMSMPYLPKKLSKYLELERGNIHRKCPFDAGLSQGNRFRVGFHVSSNRESPGLQFFRKDYSNVPDKNLSSTCIIRHESHHCHNINIMKLKYNFSAYQEQLLETALEYSNCSVNNNEDCPLWRPMVDLAVLKGYVNIHSQTMDSISDEVTVFGRIVSLCNALWANIGDNDLQGSRAYLKNIERRQALSKWIRLQSRQELMKTVKFMFMSSMAKLDVGKCNDVILEALCCGEIKLACNIANLIKQPRMALLISQSAGSKYARDFMFEQINWWILDKTDVKIPINIMCIYVVLAGRTSIVTSDGSVITPLKQLQWYQAFGCYQWYMQPYLESIKSSLDLYTEDFKSDLDIPSPFPVVSSGDMLYDNNYPFYDCCYHLLKFYCDSLYDLDDILNPPTMSRSNAHKLSIDWSPSWHLSNILTSLDCHIPSNNKICNEWAAQLERAGQWQWAAFIVLHINNITLRKSLLRDLIRRNASGTKELSVMETFLAKNLRVPKKWIYEAKAIYCNNRNDYEMEAYHWLMVGDYEKSHQLYADMILPQLVLNDRFDKMSEILVQFTDMSLDNCMVSWSQNGAVYLHYVSVMHRLKSLHLTNSLLTHTMLMEVPCRNATFKDRNKDLALQLKELTIQISHLSKLIDNYPITSNEKRYNASIGGAASLVNARRICKQQMRTVCRKCLQSFFYTDGFGKIFSLAERVLD